MKGQQSLGVEPRTPDLSSQCSATELHVRQSDNHSHNPLYICTAQVVLNASVSHLAATQHVPAQRQSPGGSSQRLTWVQLSDDVP